MRARLALRTYPVESARHPRPRLKLNRRNNHRKDWRCPLRNSRLKRVHCLLLLSQVRRCSNYSVLLPRKSWRRRVQRHQAASVSRVHRKCFAFPTRASKQPMTTNRLNHPQLQPRTKGRQHQWNPNQHPLMIRISYNAHSRNSWDGTLQKIAKVRNYI